MTTRTVFVHVCDSVQAITGKPDQPYHGHHIHLQWEAGCACDMCNSLRIASFAEGAADAKSVRLLHTLKLPYTMLKDNGEWV